MASGKKYERLTSNTTVIIKKRSLSLREYTKPNDWIYMNTMAYMIHNDKKLVVVFFRDNNQQLAL